MSASSGGGSNLARRALALAIGLALAGLLLGLLWGRLGHPGGRLGALDGETITVDGNLAEIDAFLAERAGARTPLPVGDGTELVREPISEAVAVRLFPQLVLSKRGVEFDRDCYYRYKPDLVRKIPFAERPEGEWLFRTNAAGLREDGEIAKRKPALRILVAGDSQTEGVCSNEESWPNLLERSLARGRPAGAVEVINTGKAGYQFYNYLGVLEKYAELAPDLFVVGLYGGNDLAEGLILYHYFHGTTRVACEACDRDQMQKLRSDVTVGFHTQALRQVQTFQHHPGERAAALDASGSTLLECARICRERGIDLLVVHVPPMVDVQPGFLGPALDEALAAYGLSRADLAISGTLVDELFALAARHEVATFDLRAAFSAVERQLYWNRDHHLSVAGNHVVAGLLTPLVEARIASRTAR